MSGPRPGQHSRAVSVLLLLVLVWQALGLTANAAPIEPIEPLPKYETVIVQSTSAVYVDEGSPNTNFNTYDPSYLRVGKVEEFGYRRYTYIRFSPIAVANGGPLPTGADVTAAKIRLYKETSTAGTVNFYRLGEAFAETTVTWNTRPSTSGAAIGSVALGTGTGWYEISIPATVIDAWVASPKTNYGVAAIASWTDYKSASFRSDDFSSTYRPALSITYIGAAPEPPEPPPPVDTQQCQITYTVDPPSPRPGESVTVTARATDNVALSYVAIMRGLVVLNRVDATSSGQTSLQATYTETAVLPSMIYTLIADDVGDPLPRRVDITVPVTGSGGGPTVTVTAAWEIDEVVPDTYRLIEGDGQEVVITATASDPDGIDSMTIFVNGTPHDFSGGGATTFSRTVTWVNDVRGRTSFSYSASAEDREGITNSAPGATYSIAGIDDIRLIWSCVPSFDNFSQPNLSWERMVQVFGADECWWVESWGWKDPKALGYYYGRFKDIADGGQCYGFSLMAAEFFAGRISASAIETGLTAYQLTETNSYTEEYIQARQAAQLGAAATTEELDETVDWAVDYDLVPRTVAHIEYDLERGRPGVICIGEGDGGHAIVPWMVRHMGDGTTRVYVYDCNDVGGVHNAAADLNTFGHYPYMIMSGSSWSYAFSSTSTWNDVLFYISYEGAIDNPSQRNRLGSSSSAPEVTDQDIPTLIDYLIGVFSGTGDVYFEDSLGRKTGMHSGVLKHEIPGSAVLHTWGAAFTDHEMYLLPLDAKLTAHVVGNASGDYELSLLTPLSVYSVEGKGTAPGIDDRYEIGPDPRAQEHSLRVMPGKADDDFRIVFAHRLPGSVPVLGDPFIGREYILDDLSVVPGDDFTAYPTKGGGSLSVSGGAGDVSFDVTLRSTESAEDAPASSPHIPGSSQDGVDVAAGEAIILTPADWGTTSEQGAVAVSTGTATVVRLFIDSPVYYVNGAAMTMDTAPIIREGRTLLPIRFVVEPMGGLAGWEGSEQRVTVQLGGRTVQLWIGSNRAMVEGAMRLIDPANPGVVPVLVPPGRTMMPVRFITEALGCAVGWDPITREVTITYPAP